MNLSPRPLLTTLLIGLIAPAVATAATIEVNPGDDPQAKVASASAGDVVLFKAGAHVGTISTATAHLTLRGEPGASLAAPGSAGGATPTVAFTAGNGGADAIEGLTVANQVTTGPVVEGGAAGLTVTDSLILGGKGDALHFGGGANLLVRSAAVTLLKTGIAATLDAATGDAAKTLTIDSSILVGARALSSTYATPAIAGGGAVVAARHVTAIGSIVADASAALLPGSAALAMTFVDSIVRGARTATAGSGAAATITAAPDRNSVADTAADAGTLFVRPSSLNFHLRADATAVIDRGQSTSGESDRDVDGDPRVVGPASDYGADEFVNRAPTASLAKPAGPARENTPVTLDASASMDPESASGGGIATYHWDFGDGRTADSTTPTTTHDYARRGSYQATVRVTDRQGATSPVSAPVAVEVLDGIAPTLTVAQPAVKQRLRLYRPAKKGQKKRRRARVTLFGTAQDDTGVDHVVLALRPIRTTRKGRCRWFDGKRRLRARACAAPITISVRVSGGNWRYVLPRRARLPTGPYTIAAAAIDTSGLPSPVRTVSFRFR